MGLHLKYQVLTNVCQSHRIPDNNRETFLEESAMAQPLRIKYPGTFCHIINRGNAGQSVLKQS